MIGDFDDFPQSLWFIVVHCGSSWFIMVKKTSPIFSIIMIGDFDDFPKSIPI